MGKLTGLMLVVCCCSVIYFDAVDCTSYETDADLHFVSKRTYVSTPSDDSNVEACQETCREAPDCVLFTFYNGIGSSSCERYMYPLIYGPLTADASIGSISGQFDSKLPNASLVWLGTGKAKSVVDLIVANMRQPSAAPPMTHTECQGICDGILDKYDRECVAYTFITAASWKQDKCETMATIYERGNRTAELAGTYYGARSDVNTSQTEIIGDALDTRKYPADFPAAPADIGAAAVPDYTEIPFHFRGRMSFNPLLTLTTAKSMNECAVECHRNSDCMSFIYQRLSDNDGSNPRDECVLYDAYLLGRPAPGYRQYGVIDRSGVEGALKLLKPVSSRGVYLNKLLFVDVVNNISACAKHCYEWYRPNYCLGFSYETTGGNGGAAGLCILHDALPCGQQGATSMNTWDSVEYRFGFITADNRIPTNMRQEIEQCYGIQSPTTTVAPASTASRRRHGDVQIFSHSNGKMVQGSAPQKIVNSVNRSGKCALHCHTKV